MEINKPLYETTPSQGVIEIQAKYSIFKEIANILTYAVCDFEVDEELMKKAINLVIERNDCLRLTYIKKDKKLMQYFRDENPISNIKTIKFNTMEEYKAFILKYRKIALNFKKGEVIDVVFTTMPDGKFNVIIKFCHLVVDAYGIGVIYQDLFAVYKALVNNTELPPAPGKFEELIKKDLVNKNNEQKYCDDKKFFEEIIDARAKMGELRYAGVHGNDCDVWQKQLKKGKKGMKQFFISNKSKSYMYEINKDFCDKVMDFCKETKVTPANLFFYCYSVVASKINNDTKLMSPLELCNCRGTLAEKKTAGQKVQSVACFTEVNPDKTFEENFNEFCANQNTLYRHLGFPDMEKEKMYAKAFRSSFLETFYQVIFSFIAVKNMDGVTMGMLSNGRFTTPCYLALMYNVDDGCIRAIYECQEKIIKEKHVEDYHNNLIKVLEQVMDNPKIMMKDIKVKI